MHSFDPKAHRAATQALIDVIGLDTSDEEAADRAWEAGWGYPGITRAQMLKILAWKREMEAETAPIGSSLMVEKGLWTQEQGDLETARFIRHQQAGYAAWMDGWAPAYPDHFTFTVDSGRLFVGDPCWSLGPDHRPDYQLQLPAADGTWTATWTGTGDLMMDSDEGPVLDWLFAARIGTLTVLHESVTDLGELRKAGKVVVEAGQVVVADAAAYTARMASHGDESSDWRAYGDEPMVLARERFGLRGVDAETDGSGITVSCHDHTYKVQTHVDEQGRALGLHIVFIDLDD